MGGVDAAMRADERRDAVRGRRVVPQPVGAEHEPAGRRRRERGDAGRAAGRVLTQPAGDRVRVAGAAPPRPRLSWPSADLLLHPRVVDGELLGRVVVDPVGAAVADRADGDARGRPSVAPEERARGRAAAAGAGPRHLRPPRRGRPSIAARIAATRSASPSSRASTRAPRRRRPRRRRDASAAAADDDTPSHTTASTPSPTRATCIASSLRRCTWPRSVTPPATPSSNSRRSARVDDHARRERRAARLAEPVVGGRGLPARSARRSSSSSLTARSAVGAGWRGRRARCARRPTGDWSARRR